MINQQKKSNKLNAILWIIQALLALFFVGGGIFKLLTPIVELARMWPWAGEYPTLVRITGVIDLLGGFGIFLPALTRIKPGLTPLAALGCTALIVSAIVFHIYRGEGANTPFNFVMLGLALFVFWGRWRKMPVRSN